MSGAPEIWLIRHGETDWSVSGRHTGRTDIPLTVRGRARAEALGALLEKRRFSLILTSPLSRARETCAFAGLSQSAVTDPDLVEWDYGIYEGRTTAEIREEIPDWTIWRSEVPEGESLIQVAARANGLLERVTMAEGDVAIFSHGHFLRIVTARWLGLPAESGRLFALDAGSISVLGYERETKVLRSWNLKV